MKKIIFAFICLNIFFSVAFSQIEIKLQYKQYVLENGLTVILSEDHNSPVVYGLIVTKVGSKHDPPDATGMAHYMEHMLFKGTEELGTIDWQKEKPWIDKIISLYEQLAQTSDPAKRKDIQKQINEASVEANKYAIPNELDRILKEIGSTNINANTSYDRTVYHNAFPSSEIEKWLEIYSHRFINPVFRGFQSELETVYEEKNLYTDMFQFNLLEEFNKKFFKEHPYGQQSLIGSIEHLKNPSLHKMYNFFKTYYVPNNMALIMVGDFDSDKIFPLIKEKFGKWENKPLPNERKWEEKPFNGREFVEMKLTPIKMLLLGFRAPKNGHEDQIAFEIASNILSNQSSTGLIDQLVLDNKLLLATSFYMPYNDEGQSVILTVPKIIGQKLEDAEKIILEQLDKLRKGNFDDILLEAIKLEKYREIVTQIENNEWRAITMAEYFAQGRNINEIAELPKKIMSITKQDIINVANKYLNGNYLAFYSQMGSMKKEKIEKPNFKPVISNIEAKSEFAKKLEKIPSQPIKEKFIDFRTDIQYNRIKRGVNIYVTENPYNDIFKLKIKYGLGEYYHPLLKYSCEILNVSGTKSKKVNELKLEFAKIGCTYSIYSDKSYTIIEITGLEKNLTNALKLINELIQSPQADKNAKDKIIQGEKANRKIQESEPDQIAEALYSYVLYGRKSEYLNRPSIKELKKLSIDSLLKVFQLSTTFECDIHYSGKLKMEELIPIFKNNISWAATPKNSLAPADITYNQFSENTIYLIDEPKALQSKIHFFINQKPFYNDYEPLIDAFNVYFSGDFSGLVMQEIREYRSMAYAAGARYKIPYKSGKESLFLGYIGTQSDKTIEAIQVFDSLVRFMPQKKDRWSYMINYLVKSSLTNRPDFRDLSEQVVKWKLLGYQHDPAQAKIPVFYDMQFDDMYKFYAENIQKKPMIITIVGDAKRIDLKALSKYGKINNIKKKVVFSK
jgi:predicted Zn-dependent peptidase